MDADLLFEPLADDVLIGEIALGRITDDGRHVQPLRLPLQAAVDRPAQDCRILGLELADQVAIALGFRDRHRERQQDEPPADGFVDTVEARLYGFRQ